MAFPSVAERATSKVTSNNTSHAVTLPVTGVASGDLLIAAIAWDCATGTVTLTGWTAGWTLIAENPHATGAYASTLYYKICDGSETSPLTLTTSGAEQSVHRVWRFSVGSHNASIAPQAAQTVTTGGGVSPDPPSLSPTGGSKDYFWIALAFINEGTSNGLADVDTWPAGYSQTGGDKSSASSGGIALGWAEFTNTAASENPGAFHISSDPTAEANDTMTVAIHPAAASTAKFMRTLLMGVG